MHSVIIQTGDEAPTVFSMRFTPAHNQIRSNSRLAVLFASASIAWFSPAAAESALVAVATNFAEVAQKLSAEFEQQHPHHITLTAGSTGKLYAQIINGAPFDLLLAADSERPRLLEKSGNAVAGTRTVYAVGRLTLWSPDSDSSPSRDTLEKGAFRSLAIANPKLAPYGVAAKQTLQSLGLWESLRHKIVMGENVGQTHAMVATHNVEFGLVALSYVRSPRNDQPGSRWDIPADLHEPIYQEAVLLSHGAENVAARAFLEFLTSEFARATIMSFGYDTE